jgi:hypothetical protein
VIILFLGLLLLTAHIPTLLYVGEERESEGRGRGRGRRRIRRGRGGRGGRGKTNYFI